MSLSGGTRLGPYEVVDLLGAGGMGSVYRARDTRLGRDVALKVVRADGAQGPERLRRFETEARAVARLSHPNVLSVFDVGTHEGQPYLVLELLEGETLRQRLCRGPLPASEAAELARQACAGLQAAHARGIVHRDLKPENLFLTSEGLLKILDFGVAKLKSGDGAGRTADTQTEDGLLLGTIGYLSPEQARGMEADARSDVFALGVVLYEALSGRRAFARQSAAETLAAILNDDPPPLETGSGPLPVALERIVRRCLQKEPERRFQSAHDLGLALEAVTTERAAVLAPAEETAAPYPGLRSFTETEAPRFFGREHEVAALWTKLSRRRLLALIGPSGAGKTSFVRAGLVPARPRGWAAIVSTPGTSPFLSLAQSLATELAGDAEAMRELLRFEEADAAVASVARWRRAHAGALVVVDQFEELFTQNAPEVQGPSRRCWGGWSSEADVRVLVSLRDDFLMRCHEHAALEPVFEELTPLGALSGEALRRALVEPARTAGYRFEDEGLVERMLGAVRGERGALPLLAFAVSRLWEQRDQERRLLTRDSYEEIGGVPGALAQHAESMLERIGDERQESGAGAVPGPGDVAGHAGGAGAGGAAVGVRGARPRGRGRGGLASELKWSRGAAAADVVIDAALTSDERPGAGRASTGVEVVHESLLKAWPRLVRWQAQDEDGALLRDQVRQAARLWHDRGEPDELLWSGQAYRDFALWRERSPVALTAGEEAFASAMERSATQRRRRRRAVGVGVVLVAASVALATSVLWQRAASEGRRAEAGRLLALGQLEREGNPTAALAWTLRSLEVHDTPEARLFALGILQAGPTAILAPSPGTTSPTEENDGLEAHVPRFSPDGAWLAVGGYRRVRLLSRDGQLSRAIGDYPTAGFSAVMPAFGSSGDVIVGALGGEMRAWSVPDGRELWRRQGSAGTTVPLGAKGGEIRVVTVQDGRLSLHSVPERGGEPRLVGAVDEAGSFGLGENHLAYTQRGRVFVRALDDWSRPVRVGDDSPADADVAISPDGRLVAAGNEQGEIRVWRTAEPRRPFRMLRAPGTPVADVRPAGAPAGGVGSRRRRRPRPGLRPRGSGRRGAARAAAVGRGVLQRRRFRPDRPVAGRGERGRSGTLGPFRPPRAGAALGKAAGNGGLHPGWRTAGGGRSRRGLRLGPRERGVRAGPTPAGSAPGLCPHGPRPCRATRRDLGLPRARGGASARRGSAGRARGLLAEGRSDQRGLCGRGTAGCRGATVWFTRRQGGSGVGRGDRRRSQLGPLARRGRWQCRRDQPPAGGRRAAAGQRVRPRAVPDRPRLARSPPRGPGPRGAPGDEPGRPTRSGLPGIQRALAPGGAGRSGQRAPHDAPRRPTAPAPSARRGR